jgi:hypothetical protein
LNSGYLLTWSLNNPLSNNQLWIKTEVNSNTSFTLTSRLNTAYAIDVASNKLLVKPKNQSNSNQLWTFKSLGLECPNGCSNQGVCSITTGLFNHIV